LLNTYGNAIVGFFTLKQVRASMFENIVLGVIANFLTNFIKKLLGISPLETPSPVGEPQSGNAPLPPQSTQKRRRYNQERRDALFAALAIVLNLFVLLGAATLLPLLLKGMNGMLLLEGTRTPLPYELNVYPLALLLVALLYLPSFYLVQKLTQYVVNYVHSDWSDVDRWRGVRFFIGCCFVWLPVYAGILCYWLFPKLSLGEAFGYPIGGVIAMFVYALSRR
jgi:hypothetical protein